MLLALEPRTFLSVAPPAGPQIVDSTGDVGQYTSIALDSTGSPGISYFDKTNDSLKFAQWEGDHWNNQTVVAGLGGPPVGQGTSLQFDAANHAIIAYYNQGNKDLQLASWTGTKWSIQTVDSVGDVGRYPSLALDSAGNPQISYFVSVPRTAS